MPEYDKNRSEKERFKIGTAVDRPVMDAPADYQSSGKHLDRFAGSLKIGDDEGNIANQVIDELINVEEKKADSKEGEKVAEAKTETKEEKLSESDKENFRKVGQLLALDSISKAVTGDGLSLSKEAAKKKTKKVPLGKGRMAREYKLLGRLGLGTAKVPLWVATLPARRPLSSLGALAAAGTGLYGYGKYRKKKTEKAL